MRFSAVHTAESLLSNPVAARVRPFAQWLDTMAGAADGTATAQRMSLIAFAIRVASAALAFFLQVILARWMGTFDYGVYVFVWTAMLILGGLSCLGFQTLVIRFLPEYGAKGQFELLRGILLTSRIFVVISASIVAAIGIALVQLFSALIEPYYVTAFALAFFCLPMLALGDVLEGIARAKSWALRALVPTYLLRPVLVIAYLAAGHALGYPATAANAVIAAVLATYTTTILQLVVITSDLNEVYTKGRHERDMRLWVKVAFPIFLVEGFFFLLFNSDVIMVGMFMPPSDVGIYFATVKTLALVHFVTFAVKAGVAQQFAAKIEEDSRPELRVFARRTVGWTFWPSLAMGALVLLAGPWLLALFGEQFTHGYPYLFILVVGVIARASVGPAESLLNMTGHQNICAVVFGAVLVINIIGNLILIPRYGLMGAAIATSCATVIESVLLAVLCWRRLGVVMFVIGGRNTPEAAS